MYIQFKLIRNKFLTFYDAIIEVQEFDQKNFSIWRALFQISKIMKNYQNFYMKTNAVCPIRKLYQKFCEPYIKKHA